MKIRRKRLDLNSLSYSREFDVDRSTGVHLMSVVEFIGQTSGIEKKHSGKVDLEPFATVGFLWEHCLTRADKLEHALSVEAMRMEMIQKPNLAFPGEKFWCRQCDLFMRGGRKAQKHCRKNGHTGIYSTPDAYDTELDAYVEWKATWKSSRKSHPKIVDSSQGIWRWGIQCAWNCMSLNTNLAKLTVLHINGRYKPGMPKPQAYELTYEFTDRDLLRTKRMIVDNCVDMGWI